MKIEVLVSNALVNQETGQRATIHEVVDAPEDRAEYLIDAGAARQVGAKAKKPAEKPAEDEGDTEGSAEDEKPASPAKKAVPVARKPAAK